MTKKLDPICVLCLEHFSTHVNLRLKDSILYKVEYGGVLCFSVFSLDQCYIFDDFFVLRSCDNFHYWGEYTEELFRPVKDWYTLSYDAPYKQYPRPLRRKLKW